MLKSQNIIMAIQESQFSTWANQGSITTSAKTYESIKNCIDGINWNSDIYYEIYLQGSYKNSTNIYGNSDVDIVVEFQSIFSSDTSDLDDIGKEVHNSLEVAKYNLDNFKDAIVKKLKDNYDSVKVGSKAIKICGNSTRLDADVIVCHTYKKYLRNSGSRSLTAINGIIFTDTDNGNKIVNYPKVHYDNGVKKNQSLNTNSNYKSTVRIFRNIRATLVNSGKINSNLVPPYFVECLIYNGNNHCFTRNTYQLRVYELLIQILKDFENNSNDNYLCQNELRYLFGTSDQQWNKQDAKKFIDQVLILLEG